ncbi:MAG TPA: AAA family ATPase, partial [Candidatus Dojkabacteria bacterium]
NNWVKQGFDLHRSKEEYEKCLFCQKSLEDGFLESLTKHFSKDYEELQNKITDFISKLNKLKKEKLPEINSNISSELQSNYVVKAKALNGIIDSHNQWINDAVEKLQEKYQNTLTVVQALKKTENFKKAYDTALKELNSVINSHNSQVDNHDAVVKSTKEKLEYHLIAVAIEEQDYAKIKKNLENSINNLEIEKQKLEKIKEKIDDLEKKTSNIGKAVQEINKHLEEFFGRKEIQLKLDEGNLGYFIEKDGHFAQNLSEGEKTAIAFSYFIAKTLERDFKVTDGIIFIDDPISSFDSNFIYHCFSVIKNHFKDAGQLFISTHNFELLNLVKEWYSRKNSKAKSKGKNEICEFYMLENVIENGKRHASIIPLEETLRNFKSEYHYLFYLLCRFSDKAVPEYADYYTIGNVARRFLEIFANFKIPTTGDLSSKIGELGIDTSRISETEQDKVYKLIQEFSHGMDPTSTIEHKDKRESREAIRILLNMVRESDPKHFELLQKNIPS